MKTNQIQFTQSLIYIIGAIALSIILIGCGPNKTAVSGKELSLSSRSTHQQRSNTNFSVITIDSNEYLADCNKIESNDDFVIAQMVSHYHLFGEENNSVTYLRFSEIIEEFESDHDFKIKFYSWKADSIGTVDEPKALRFRLQNRNNAADTTGYFSELTYNVLANFNKSSSLTSKLAQTIIVIADLDLSDDVLQIAGYQNGKTQADFQADALIPAFYANPNKYRYEYRGKSRAKILQELHPPH